MKKVIMIAIAVILAMPMVAQQKNTATKNKEQAAANDPQKETRGLEKVYNERLNPMHQIDKALEEARSTHRLVICQVGGN